MRVNRQELLTVLKVARVGLTKKELLEQSNAFILDEGHITTYNGEVFTRAASPLKGITGAIPATEFQSLLERFPEEELEVTQSKGEVRIKGKRRAAGIACHAEIHLPYGDVPSPDPGTWKSLPDGLMGILVQASRVCGRDESQPRTTEIHVTGDVVEACDNQRLYRVKKKTGLPELLIPAVSLDTIGTVDFDQVSAGDWLHLLTKSGHRVSVRCVTAAYPDLKPILRMRDAQQIELPKDLGEILGRAQVMQELAFDPLVEVAIEDNRLKLVARKEGGWFRETQSVTYSGPALRFHINPKFLLEVLTHSHVVSVGEGRMRMKGGNVTFIVCLASPGVND